MLPSTTFGLALTVTIHVERENPIRRPKVVLEYRFTPVALGLSEMTMPAEPKASILWSYPKTARRQLRITACLPLCVTMITEAVSMSPSLPISGSTRHSANADAILPGPMIPSLGQVRPAALLCAGPE